MPNYHNSIKALFKECLTLLCQNLATEHSVMHRKLTTKVDSQEHGK